jgi:hypothetical protein
MLDVELVYATKTPVLKKSSSFITLPFVKKGVTCKITDTKTHDDFAILCHMSSLPLSKTPSYYKDSFVSTKITEPRVKKPPYIISLVPKITGMYHPKSVSLPPLLKKITEPRLIQPSFSFLPRKITESPL